MFSQGQARTCNCARYCQLRGKKKNNYIHLITLFEIFVGIKIK